ECHHRMHHVKGPRVSQVVYGPSIGQQTPAFADVDVLELETPEQRRTIGERRHVSAARSGDTRVVDRESGLGIVRIQMEQRAMPSEMDGQSGTLVPCRFNLGKKREAVANTPLHFHHMSDDVNGAGMTGIECQRAPRDFFGATVLSIFLEGKSV